MQSALDETQKLLTVPEVAARLRLSKWSVYRLIESGSLPAIRVSAAPLGPIRVAEGQLERWLSSSVLAQHNREAR